MVIACKSLLTLCAIFFLVSLTAPNPASCEELVGIVPFVNQRDTPADNWIGFYIQARMQAYMSAECNCQFHSLHTIRLWQFGSNPSTPLSIRNSILITGSFQVVLSQGLLQVQIKRFSPESMTKDFEVTFNIDELEIKLDQLSDTLAKWIDPAFKRNVPFNFPQASLLAQEVFKLRQMLYEPKTIPTIQSILRLEDLLGQDGPPDFVGDLAEAMIISSNELLEKEKRTWLDDAERILRSVAMKHLRDSRIHSLLAEVFYLNKKETAWVLQTAELASQLDSSNDLAYLMIVLAGGNEKEKRDQALKKLNDVNPWIWPTDTKGEYKAQFQKGIFRTELLSLQGSLH